MTQKNTFTDVKVLFIFRHFHFQMLRAVSRPRAHQYIILRECKLFADNDTGLVHYASACYVCAISLLHQLRIEHSRSLSSLIMRS